MPRRSSPKLKAHQEWLGYPQSVGLVVALATVQAAGWVLTRSGSDLIERQQRYRDALEPLNPSGDAELEDRLGFSRLNDLLIEHLGWSDGQIQGDPPQLEPYSREPPGLGETLKPTAVVAAVTGHGTQMLMNASPPLMPLDQKISHGDHLWRVTPQERFERLLRETGVEAGLLFNGSQLRWVVAPKGESSGHLTFPLQDPAEVSGRLMFSGLGLLLGQSRVFFDPAGAWLADVLKASRSFQAVVSTALADQVLAALWNLLRGFEQAGQITRHQGKTLLGSMPDQDPQRLYRGLITVLMRLVFLLYAEKEALMPADAIYGQNYNGTTADYLPARRGQLFDPEVYPSLETPWLSNGVVCNVLRNLLVVNGEHISYRALDVEEIGSVYEGIMGHAVHPMAGRCIGLKSKPQGVKKQIITVINLDQLLALDGGKRKKWLEGQAQASLPAKAARPLKTAASESTLLKAVAPRMDGELFDGSQVADSLVFQPTEERRRSGSHYTPRSLTRPVVEEALRSWLERCGQRPTAPQILDLKIRDLAMGSGAFLVESCRDPAELLEQAWTQEDLPPTLQSGGLVHGEDTLIYARHLIAQSCLYGVDKNPSAVNLAKLSLWLVTLSEDTPFTLVDHALKCGDSLVGYSDSEVQLGLLDQQLKVRWKLSTARQTTFDMDSRDDATDQTKRQELAHQEQHTNPLRLVGNLMVAAFFNSKKPKEREETAQVYAAMVSDVFRDEDLDDAAQQLLKYLKDGEHGITLFHWQLEFPEVFDRNQPGFDIFLGNPSFAGHVIIAISSHKEYTNWLRKVHAEGQGKYDIVAHFFRRCFIPLRSGGRLGLIANNAIYTAHSRIKWPGMAVVVVSVVHVFKETTTGEKRLYGRPVQKITAFPFVNGGHEDARPLAANAGQTQDISSPIATMERLIAENLKNQGVIFSYIDGEEVNNSPTHTHRRYVVNFGERNQEECWQEYPEMMKILEKKVKSKKFSSAAKVNTAHSRRAMVCWQHDHHAKNLYAAIARCERVFVITCRAVLNMAIAKVQSGNIFDQTLVVCTDPRYSHFSCISSMTHEVWMRLLCSSIGDVDRYSPTDCYVTFPFPVALLVKISEDNPTLMSLQQALDNTGEHDHQFRAALMIENNEDLTKTCNRFHDPEETDSQVMELRRLHGETDQAMLNAHGWGDIPTACGFGLDYLDLNDDVFLPPELQEHIDSGDLFFLKADEACAFQGQLRAYGVVSSKKKLPWRYRWPDAVGGEDVLARLLALNAEYYAEATQGLHSSKKKAAKASGKSGKRRGRPLKNPRSAEAGSLGLG